MKKAEEPLYIKCFSNSNNSSLFLSFTNILPIGHFLHFDTFVIEGTKKKGANATTTKVKALMFPSINSTT